MKLILLAVAGMVAAIAVWVSTTAGAAAMVGCYVGCVAPTSVPVEPPGPVVHAVSLAPPSSASSTSSSLPFTGTDVIELVVIAVVLIAMGWAMARRRRSLG
jgi:hypothetical protein